MAMTTPTFGGDAYVQHRQERSPLDAITKTVKSLLGQNMIVDPGTFNADSKCHLNYTNEEILSSDLD